MSINAGELWERLRRGEKVILTGKDSNGNQEVREIISHAMNMDSLRGIHTMGFEYRRLFYEGKRKKSRVGVCDIFTMAKWATGYLKEKEASKRKEDLTNYIKAAFFYARRARIDNLFESDLSEVFQRELRLKPGQVRYFKSLLVREPVQDPVKELPSRRKVVDFLQGLGLKIE